MSATSERGRKSSGSSPLGKLSRMLASMSRRWPQTSLLVTWEGFGVRRIDGSYLHVVSSGRWTNEDMRDCLALFATWLVADPDKLRPAATLLDGVSLTGLRESARSNGLRDSESTNMLLRDRADYAGPNHQVLAAGEFSPSTPASVPTEYGS